MYIYIYIYIYIYRQKRREVPRLPRQAGRDLLGPRGASSRSTYLSLSLSLSISLSLYTYTHTYIYICIYAYVHIYIYAYVYIYIYTYIHISLSLYIYIYNYMSIYSRPLTGRPAGANAHICTTIRQYSDRNIAIMIIITIMIIISAYVCFGVGPLGLLGRDPEGDGVEGQGPAGATGPQEGCGGGGHMYTMDACAVPHILTPTHTHTACVNSRMRKHTI